MTLATVATFGLLRSSMHTLDQSLYRPAPIKKLNRTEHEAKKKWHVIVPLKRVETEQNKLSCYVLSACQAPP